MKNNSFQKNLFLSIGGIFVLFAICFGAYQSKREKEYKIDILHARLQMYNYEMMQSLGEAGLLNDSLFGAYTQQHAADGMRVTLIDAQGRVLRDNEYHSADSLPNHLERLEVQEALKHGSGYDIKRKSQSTQETYFYSATRFGNLVVRSAVPYSAELTESLKADNTYIYFTIALTLLLGIALYWSTHRISRHIGYLREFAQKAEDGDRLDHELERKLPDDELGDISHTIIQLYYKLRNAEEDKQRIKRQLTQNAAHELKTPAASIHGFLESILDNPDMDADKRQHFLERCYAQSDRMNKLLQDMSTLTKLDEMEATQYSHPAEQHSVDVLRVIQNVVDDTSLALQDKGISLVANTPPKVEVMGDTSLIYSIFRNLVDNTITYAQDADTLRIECAETVRNGAMYYDFAVIDNGKGIPPEHLPHIFERFYRVDKGRSRMLGGTGLGLAIVKNAVSVHGGTIAAETTPGGGLTIRFGLKKTHPVPPSKGGR